MHFLTRALTAQNLQISTAKISTFGHRVVDVFYVKDQFGLKVESEARLRAIRDSLMQVLQIDVASEYLVMAATLAHLKSKTLLPPDPTQDDGEIDGEEIDPRQELIRRLLEYQKYKEAADQLGKRPVVGRNVWSRGAPAEDAVANGINADAVAPLAPFPVHKLIEAFDRVMQQAKVKDAHNVLIDRLSVSQKIAELTDRLEAEGGFTFNSMFSFLRDGVARSIEDLRHEAVVTFLALLEMIRLKLVRVFQSGSFGPIRVYKRARPADAPHPIGDPEENRG